MQLKPFFLAFGLFQQPKHLLSYGEAKVWLRHYYPQDVLYGAKSCKINCEHVIPRSLLRKKKHPESDLHCLMLSNAKLNSHRQNYAFRHVCKTKGISLDSHGKRAKPENTVCIKNIKDKSFEPPDEQKGRIARIVGYYLWTYNDMRIIDGLMKKECLLSWHSKYPITKTEKDKNESVFQVQKNKNIFICYPFLMPIVFSTPVLLLRKCFTKKIFQKP